MIQKLHRLQQGEVQQTLRYGVVIHSPSFLLRAHNTHSHTPPNCSVVVGKKVSKKATQRNRCKRVVREVFRGIIPTLKDGVFVVLVANPSLQSMSFQEIERELHKKLQALSLVKQH